MWNYALFLPAAVFLALLAVLQTREHATRSPVRLVMITVGFLVHLVAGGGCSSLRVVFMELAFVICARARTRLLDR